ncbi:MAG: hypothetical protein F9K40_16460 [Kofleriaceae bacterium]|nr:MAG: hypothetical protein F9K40_16460 [Kofleriaceae bacterium]MBZ0230863.1 hypothetical protein [Kofleriaceae bacterium]
MTRYLVALALALSVSGCVAEDEDTAPVDAPLAIFDCYPPRDSFNPCGECGPGTMCVQLLDGTCSSSQVMCKPIVTGCEQPVCSPDCDQAYCDPGGISTCSAAPCPIDLPDVFHCYGV